MGKRKNDKKLGRNDPCPCGSNKKYKKCCFLHLPGVSTVTLVRATQRGPVEIPIPGPVDVFFDTSVWRSLSAEQIAQLESLKIRNGLRYRYSITSYIEMVSHLHDIAFARVRSWFKRIHELCEPEVMPSPELDFMNEIGLTHYIDPAWVPDQKTISAAVEILAKASSLADIPERLVNTAHYRKFREVDENSFLKLIEDLRDRVGKGSVTRGDADKVLPWFVGGFANFFLLIRPSGKKVSYKVLKEEEQLRFKKAFTSGSGLLFFAHCMAVVALSVNLQQKIDLNHLYDMLQLLLVRDNRLFVTKDKVNFRYETLDPQVQRIVSLEDFLGNA